MIEMKGKKILVTGAARGIGFGIAEAFLDRTPMERFAEFADISRVVLMLTILC